MHVPFGKQHAPRVAHVAPSQVEPFGPGVPPTRVHASCVSIVQTSFGKQHFTRCDSQFASSHVTPLPWNVPPSASQRSGERNLQSPLP